MNQNNPPRSESPRIPSGGVDAVAARATYQYEARAAALGLEDEVAVENKAVFQSARGMKRAISGSQVCVRCDNRADDRSPNKAGPGFDRGPRRPLEELPKGQDDWQAKRARGY